MAASQQRDTLDFSISHSDASISRKSRLVSIRQLTIHGNVGASFWWQDAIPHTNNEILTRINNINYMYERNKCSSLCHSLKYTGTSL